MKGETETVKTRERKEGRKGGKKEEGKRKKKRTKGGIN